MLYIFLVAIIILYYFWKKNNNLVCLMYHNVFLEGIPGIIGKDEFERHMEYIREKGMKSFKMEELEDLNYRLPQNSVLVTFDDGYKNNYTNAFPVLKKYNIKATVFLNTKYIGKDDFYLNWDEIKEMYMSGLIDFQMHTHSHSPTIRKTEIKGFFLKNENQFVKREYFTIFNKNNKNTDFRNFDFTGLPVFKIRSAVSLRGYKLKDDFFLNYRKIEESPDFRNLSEEDKKKYVNNEFKKNRNRYFEEISDKEFLENVIFEITENKRLIEKNLNKEAEYLAYPWGHVYKGKREDLEKLGVKGFVFTTGGMNSRKLNYKRILRINGDALKEYEKFFNKMKKANNR